MGFFDFLKTSKNKSVAPQEAPVDKNVARLGRVAADKRAQNYDRLEAIQGLAVIGSADSAAALLRRFSFYIEPSITDQEEKDAALRGILAAGQAAIEPIREFSLKAESLTWAMKLLEQLLPAEAYIDELLTLLKRFDTEYTKNPEPKLQLVAALEAVSREDVRAAVEPFLEDVHEPIRFHAVATVFAQDNPESVPALCQALVNEESVRVKNRICEGLIARNWAVPASLQVALEPALPSAFMLQDGQIRRARGY